MDKTPRETPQPARRHSTPAMWQPLVLIGSGRTSNTTHRTQQFTAKEPTRNIFIYVWPPMLNRSLLSPCEYLGIRMRIAQSSPLQTLSSRHHNVLADSIEQLFRRALEAIMVNAAVACSVVLSLFAVYWLARLPDARSQTSKRGFNGRILRLLRIAVRRAAHRHEGWLTDRGLDRRRRLR
jgi:hypothetical protein